MYKYFESLKILILCKSYIELNSKIEKIYIVKKTNKLFKMVKKFIYKLSSF